MQPPSAVKTKHAAIHSIDTHAACLYATSRKPPHVPPHCSRASQTHILNEMAAYVDGVETEEEEDGTWASSPGRGVAGGGTAVLGELARRGSCRAPGEGSEDGLFLVYLH